MKIAIYSSRFKPMYSLTQEIPQTYCVDENCVITVKAREHGCPKPCESDAPFGIVSRETCCTQDTCK